MILNPIRRAYIRPISFSLIKQTRSLRPSIKIGKERFQLTLDVRQFNKDEIKVKAHPDYVIIEGKQEKSTEQGYILRQFIRKFKLPDGCLPQKIESKLSPEGILTITAPRSFSDSNLPCEAVVVPISYGPTEKECEKSETDKEKTEKEEADKEKECKEKKEKEKTVSEKKPAESESKSSVNINCTYPKVKPQPK